MYPELSRSQGRKAGADAHFALIDTSSLDFFKLPFEQALRSCNWKCAAPAGQSPELCSSPVTFPSKEVLGLGTMAVWSPRQGDLGQAAGV